MDHKALNFVLCAICALALGCGGGSGNNPSPNGGSQGTVLPTGTGGASGNSGMLNPLAGAGGSVGNGGTTIKSTGTGGATSPNGGTTSKPTATGGSGGSSTSTGLTGQALCEKDGGIWCGMTDGPNDGKSLCIGPSYPYLWIGQDGSSGTVSTTSMWALVDSDPNASLYECVYGKDDEQKMQCDCNLWSGFSYNNSVSNPTTRITPGAGISAQGSTEIFCPGGDVVGYCGETTCSAYNKISKPADLDPLSEANGVADSGVDFLSYEIKTTDLHGKSIMDICQSKGVGFAFGVTVAIECSTLISDRIDGISIGPYTPNGCDGQ